MNEDRTKPSLDAFLIVLDLAIPVRRTTSSGAHSKAGTRVFMDYLTS
jgi:hypothetical protein